MYRMRDDQEFNIRFVQIIKNERCLYDKTIPEYRCKEEHDRIWQKVATEANESGKAQTFSKKESHMTKFVIEINVHVCNVSLLALVQCTEKNVVIIPDIRNLHVYFVFNLLHCI